MSNGWRGTLYAVAAGVLFGCIGYFGMNILRGGLSVPNMLFWRFLVAGLVITIVSLAVLKKSSNFGSLKSFILDAVFYSGSTTLYFLSSTYIGTGLAVVILFISPALLSFYTGFFITRRCVGYIILS